jgi:drug/metabolite transporter (DMT)-like permease
MTSHRFAALLMVAQAMLFAAETAAIHQIGSQMSLMQLVLLRSAGGVILALVLARNTGWAVMRTGQLQLQLLRGTISLLYLWVMIYSFSQMPFADATAISYTQVAYIAIFSVLILGEPISPARWAAALMGIVGALLIAKPTFSSWNSVYLVALIGTSLNGLAFVLNRYLQRKDTEITTMFYSNLVPVLGSAPALLMVELPTSETLLWLPGLVLFGPIGMFLGIVALKRARAAVLGPYTLLRLVMSVGIGLVAFHELPDMPGIFGTVLILSGCLLSLSGGNASVEPTKDWRGVGVYPSRI